MALLSSACRLRSRLLFLLLPIVLHAQHVRLGIVAGAPITPDYPAQYFPEQRTELPDGTVLVRPAFSVLPGPRSLIGGAMLEWELSDRFSIEGNAIYRRLRTAGDPPVPTVTWEFPVLAKYRFLGGGSSPFIEAGPSFRSTGNRNTEPSHTGFSAGAGFDWQWRGLRFAPTVRYTRWRADPFGTDPSKQDQVEALFAVSRGGLSNRKPFGGRVRFGVTAGQTLIRPLQNEHFSGDLAEPFYPPGSTFESSRLSLRTWVVGPRVEFELRERWLLAAEANYRQIRFRTTDIYSLADQSPVRQSYTGKSAVLWQFPVLVKRRLASGPVAPFLEAGPSFRLPQDLGGHLSTLGGTAGAGVALDWRGIRLEPGLRFTHWGAKTYRNGETAPNDVRRNQLDAVIGITF